MLSVTCSRATSTAITIVMIGIAKSFTNPVSAEVAPLVEEVSFSSVFCLASTPSILMWISLIATWELLRLDIIVSRRASMRPSLWYKSACVYSFPLSLVSTVAIVGEFSP